MVRRAEYLSKSAIDSGWPHQIAMEADRCTGHNYRTQHYFIDRERLSHCSSGHGFYRQGIWFTVFCFAEREHAERFQRQFGGEFIDPKDRPRWPGGR